MTIRHITHRELRSIAYSIRKDVYNIVVFPEWTHIYVSDNPNHSDSVLYLVKNESLEQALTQLKNIRFFYGKPLSINETTMDITLLKSELMDLYKMEVTND